MVDAFTPANRQRLGDADEVAKICGYAKRTVLRYADRGLMPFGRKIGSLRRWDLDEIESWIASGCRPVRAPGRGVRT